MLLITSTNYGELIYFIYEHTHTNGIKSRNQRSSLTNDFSSCDNISLIPYEDDILMADDQPLGLRKSDYCTYFQFTEILTTRVTGDPLLMFALYRKDGALPFITRMRLT